MGIITHLAENRGELWGTLEKIIQGQLIWISVFIIHFLNDYVVCIVFLMHTEHQVKGITIMNSLCKCIIKIQTLNDLES